jgi:hypothetical protein
MKWHFVSFSDVIVHDILDVSNKARRLFMGPFNPTFDICANMIESLEEVTSILLMPMTIQTDVRAH